MPQDPGPINWMQSLESLRAGGLPTRAKRRLVDEAPGPEKKLFTSDLSTSELLLAKEAGLVPISQVMGSSIYHIGRIPDYKGATGELDVISTGHREARRMALHRLELEAAAVGADVVVGVRLGERLVTRGEHGKGGDDGDEVIEFTVVGTAMQAPWLDVPAKQKPVLTDLSGQEMWALWKDGFEPVGIVFDFCRYHVWHVLKPGTWNAGGEITSAQDAVETARKTVVDRVRAQARAKGAEFVIGKDIGVSAHEVPCGYEGCRLNDLDVDVSWFGTGVRRARWAPPPKLDVPELVLGMVKLGRRRDEARIEGDDASEKLAEEAKKLEEEAAKEGE